jgi:hypothetical protein
MKYLVYTLIALSCQWFSHTSEAVEKVTMRDLNVLHTEGQDLELLKKAGRVRPSERSDEWKKLVEQAAISHLSKPLHANFSSKHFRKLIDSLNFYPFLAKRKEFSRAYNQMATQYLSECYPFWRSHCYEDISKNIELMKGDPQSLIEMAHAVGKIMRPGTGTFFYHTAFRHSDDRRACGDDRLRKSTIHALKNRPGDEIALKAKDIAFKFCLKEMKTELLEETGNSSSYFLDNTCRGMIDNKLLKGLKKRRCVKRLLVSSK